MRRVFSAPVSLGILMIKRSRDWSISCQGYKIKCLLETLRTTHLVGDKRWTFSVKSLYTTKTWEINVFSSWGFFGMLGFLLKCVFLLRRCLGEKH